MLDYLPEKGSDPGPGKAVQALHQCGAAAIISGLGSTPEGGLPTGDPVRKEGSQHAYAARCNRNPVTGVFPEKGAQRALCRFRGVMFSPPAVAGTQPRDQGRL